MVKKEPLRILYQTHFNGRGLAIAADSFNWTVLIFREGQDPSESRKRWHFNNLPKMLRAVHQFFLKERIMGLPFEDMAKAVEASIEQVEILGEALVREILRKAPHGALPRFPCNHVIEG